MTSAINSTNSISVTRLTAIQVYRDYNDNSDRVRDYALSSPWPRAVDDFTIRRGAVSSTALPAQMTMEEDPAERHRQGVIALQRDY